MEKDIGKIKKNDETSIVIRVDDFGGKRGLTIREFTSSDRYTGFTKSGTRIPAQSFKEFKAMINEISEEDMAADPEPAQGTLPDSTPAAPKDAKLDDVDESELL